MTNKKSAQSTMDMPDIVISGSEKMLKCGLIMPIAKSESLEPEHWRQVQSIIKEALADTDFHVRMVSESEDVGVIHKSIVQNIYQDDIVICDVSTRNANVMFELGMRLAFDKPTIIVKDDVTAFSFDTQIIEHVMYKRDLKYYDIIDFKARLKEKVLATYESSKSSGYTTFLKHFTIDRVAKLDERTVGRDEYLIERLDRIQHSITTLERDMVNMSSKERLLRVLGDFPNERSRKTSWSSELEKMVADFKRSIGIPGSGKISYSSDTTKEELVNQCVNFIRTELGIELSPLMISRIPEFL